MLFQYSCLLINNYATAKGGAYYVDNGSYAEMANNTLYGNAAINSDGGAIYSEGDMVIDNTIFYRNAMYSGGTIPSYTAGSDIANMGSSVFLSNSSLQFNPALAGNYTGYTDPGNSWVSNIYPQFLDSANKRGADNTWATADDGLSLLPSSNMINAGLNAAVTGAATQGDLAGAARIQLGTVDMGAYESAVALSCPIGNTVYVDSSVAASGSGGTWTGAFKTLHEAMAVADRCTDITHILIAKGTYFPTPDNNRDSAIVIRRSNIKIYGGYPKGGGSRNIAANPTIIDGNIGGGNYSYHLVVIAGIYTATDSIILDGLTLRNAKADGGNVFRTYNGETLERMYGGGIYLRNVRNGNKTVFRNCTFSNNLATNGGGAIMNNVYSSVWITSCQFIGNTNNNASSIYGGGAVFSASNSIAAINSSIFTANRSATAGGAIFQNDTSLSVINCTFSGDTAAAGGAISLINQSPFYSRNNLFRNNVATGGHGGAIYANHTGTDTLVNNVFTGNKCTGNSNYGGGAAALIGGRSYVVHNTFYADSANGYSGALLLSGVSAVYNNIFYKCYNSSSATPDIHSSGTHTAGNNSFSNTNPVFYNETNLPGADNVWFTSDDGLRLKNNSPAINTGDNSKIPANITTDITGSARIQHIAEPGAYEGYVCMGNDKGVFSTNIATAAGGVIHQDTGTVTLNQSRFTSNTANTGGVFYLTGTARLKANAAVFHENYSAADGGVLRMNNLADDTVYNSLFIHNRAGGDGASIYTMQANKYFGSNTFYGDTATGGTHATAFVNADNVVVNSIFYKTSHEISGTYAGGFNSDNNTNPLFINETNPAGADGIPGTVDDGLRILNNSPVKDAGTNAYVPAGNTTDITGRQRIRNGVVDRGAYEGAVYAQHVLYVDQYKSGNGSSWGNALRRLYVHAAAPASLGGSWAFPMNNLNKALALANACSNINEIWVAAGTYKPSEYPDEFDAYNLVNAAKLPAYPSDATGKEKLRIWQMHGTSSTGTPGSYSGTDTLLNPDDAAIVWNGADSRWEVSFNVTGFSGFFVTAASSVPLPVQLISFEAVKGPDNKSSVLEWQVNREAGMSRYKIQRSSNGNTFETIGSVAANGKERYQFMDEQPLPGINFYRLSMEETDGSYTYSRVIRITFRENNQPGIVIYPNPAATILNINPDGIAAGLLALQYTDLAGRTARTIRVNYIPGEVIHDDISTLPAGSYILTLPGTHIPPVKLTVLK
ncbi:polymorphic outer membrane protein repeat-containing domain protein [Ostertagia ostertagi]